MGGRGGLFRDLGSEGGGGVGAFHGDTAHFEVVCVFLGGG